MCFSHRVRLLLIVIAAGVSVSAETRKSIYRIRRYCKAMSEYSPIRSIGLTLIGMTVVSANRQLDVHIVCILLLDETWQQSQFIDDTL